MELRISSLKIFASLAVLFFGAGEIGNAANAEMAVNRTPLKIVRYELNLAIDYDRERISGEARLAIHNPSALPVPRMPLVLYRLFKVGRVVDGEGRPLEFTPRVLSFEDWEEFQANFLDVIPSSPIPAGGRTEVIVQYAGPLVGYAETGMRYVRDRIDKAFTILRTDCLVYPQIGVPSWKINRAMGLPQFDYLLKVTVPDGLFVANGGAFVEKIEGEGRATFVYRNVKPAWRIDAAVAPYKMLEDRATRSRIFHFPDDEEGARRVAAALRESLALLTKWFGPPAGFEGFSVIEIPEGFGSQADVTSILQTRDAFADAANLPQLYHEISHLWGVPALDPLPSRLESEGMAMFLQYAVQENREGRVGALERGAERCRKRFIEACGKDPKAAGTPISDYGKADLTDLSYNKGMLYFYFLDKLAGRDRLLAAWADFFRRYGQTGATTANFISHIEGNLGIDISRFDADWIYGANSSELLLSSTSLDEIAALYRERR